MTVYNLSKGDKKTMVDCAKSCGICSLDYHKIYAAVWLSWYRVFYRMNSKKERIRNMGYFLDEIEAIVNKKRMGN